jgi:(2Fe-2S) ferredoxin
MITNASFLSSADREFHSSTSHLLSPKDELPTKPTSLYLFPSFKYVTLPVASDSALYNSSLDALIQNYVHPSMLETNPLQEEKDIILQQRSEHDKDHVDLRPQPVHEVVVLICGHGGRDSRCGALGLPLQHEFEDKLRRASINVLPHCRPSEEVLSSKAARVGLISHIGGHKWAGNVIIYIPPRWREQEGHSLSGSAIWYGRVEPKHVEGIVKETVLGGRIVGELWRGGMQLSKTKEGLAWTSIPRPAS